MIFSNQSLFGLTSFGRISWGTTLAQTDLSALSNTLPAIEDGGIKQVMLPQSDVCVTPVPSCGLIHEFWSRLKERRLPFVQKVIQPTAAAIGNHGEALLRQGGHIRLMRRGIADIKRGHWKGSFVALAGRVEAMNVSAGMVALGWPAMTAIGGLVHALERKLDCVLEFAFGMTEANWQDGVARIVVQRSKPGFSLDQFKSTADIVLLVRPAGRKVPLTHVAQVLRGVYRVAGGSLFDAEIQIHRHALPPVAAYLIDASADIGRGLRNGGNDALDVALDMYGQDGEWRDGFGWYQPRNGYTLVQSGYGFLETPRERENVRCNCRHSWAEPLFCLVTQGAMSDSAWWRCERSPQGVCWRGG